MPKGSSKKTTRNTKTRRRRSALTWSPQPKHGHAYVMDGDRPTHVLVPVDVYEEMLKASMVESAVAKLDDPKSKWVDADAFGRKLAGEQVARARRAKRLTQKQLGAKLGIPQSQISRIERKPDHTTLRTLKRIAKALGVDVRALV